MATLYTRHYSKSWVGALQMIGVFDKLFYSRINKLSSFQLGISPVSSASSGTRLEPDRRVGANPLPPHPAEPVADFEQLALPLANTLFATAYRLTGNFTRAEDLVQETYVLAWQKFKSYQAGTNFKAWIFRILILTSRNEGRNQRKLPVQLSDEAAQSLAQEEPHGEPITRLSPVIYNEFVDDDFKKALDRLDADHRLVLMLVTLGELSYQECSEFLELPIGTVMSRLYRARKQLQSELYAYARERGLLRGEARREAL